MPAAKLYIRAVVAYSPFCGFSSRYECTDGYCSKNNGLDRGNVLGCLDFCYLDVDKDLLLQRTEFQIRFDEWRGDGIIFIWFHFAEAWR